MKSILIYINMTAYIYAYHEWIIFQATDFYYRSQNSYKKQKKLKNLLKISETCI